MVFSTYVKFFCSPFMMTTAVPSAQKSPSTYEFTKRKRWPDLLITDLVDSVLFILSPSCKVLYVATAVTELLGWRDVDLIDLDFIKLINRTLQAKYLSQIHRKFCSYRPQCVQNRIWVLKTRIWCRVLHANSTDMQWITWISNQGTSCGN